jgi:hypothetical protein
LNEQPLTVTVTDSVNLNEQRPGNLNEQPLTVTVTDSVSLMDSLAG